MSMNWDIKLLFFIIHYFVGVGFFMFMERKLLSLSQFREGPIKVYFKGVFQFIYDMLKLINKDWMILIYNNFTLCYFFYLFLFFNMILLWVLMPLESNYFNMSYSYLYLILLLVFKLYLLVVLVYSCLSIYSMLSILRMLVQLISYDIIIILVVYFKFMMILNMHMSVFFFNWIYSLKLFNFSIFFFWVVSIMVELLRLPFDFYEGESELISGFNLEFSSFLFLLLVLIEYMELLFFLLLTLIMFFFCVYSLYFFFIFSVLCYMIIWFRVFFVRYRLDKMMFIMWKFIFPMMMVYLIFYYLVNYC